MDDLTDVSDRQEGELELTNNVVFARLLREMRDEIVPRGDNVQPYA